MVLVGEAYVASTSIKNKLYYFWHEMDVMEAGPGYPPGPA
jgi:hypothetical protein